jgi:anti-sigma-K factor RskA
MPRFLSWRALSRITGTWITGHTLAGPYALDALDAAERARFERHLRRCATCPAEVRGFAAVAASLGLAAATTPPPSLKGRVLADVAALDAARSADAEIAAVLSAADARIASAATSAGGTATVVASRRDGTVVFTSSGLPVLPPSSVYELWFIGSAGVRPAGLVPASDPAGAAGVLVLASGLSRDDAIGVTVEPAGGTAAPTTTPIVVLTLR